MAVLFLIACQQPITGDVVEDIAEMGETASALSSEMLFVSPESVEQQREEFVSKLKSAPNKRQLYEEYMEIIGANGVLDGIEKLWPKCHSQAHDAGKIIYAKVGDIATGLRICADACYSGCMHGVLMEAFSSAKDPDDPDGHVDFVLLKEEMDKLCYDNNQMTSSYSPGDCAHGVGHALMFLTKYDVPEAVDGCKVFDDDAMKYYCATGAYMEYVTENDEKDAKTKSLFYPCDEFDYPGACSRYKMVHVARRHYSAKKKVIELVQECEKLEGKFRLGCFHGLGNGHMGVIAIGRMNLREVCDHGTEEEQFVCIEGAIERMAKYHKPVALKVCEELEGRNRETCFNAIDQGMYNMEKDFTLYLRE